MLRSAAAKLGDSLAPVMVSSAIIFTLFSSSLTRPKQALRSAAQSLCLLGVRDNWSAQTQYLLTHHTLSMPLPSCSNPCCIPGRWGLLWKAEVRESRCSHSGRWGAP